METTKERLIRVLNDVGILIDEFEGDIDLSDYVSDSIEFVNLIIAVEDEFNIEIPDEFLLFETLQSFNLIVNIIDKGLANQV